LAPAYHSTRGRCGPRIDTGRRLTVLRPRTPHAGALSPRPTSLADRLPERTRVRTHRRCPLSAPVRPAPAARGRPGLQQLSSSSCLPSRLSSPAVSAVAASRESSMPMRAGTDRSCAIRGGVAPSVDPTAFGSKGERHEQRAERNAQQPPREAVVTPIAHDEPGNDAGRKPDSQKDGQNECARHDELTSVLRCAKDHGTSGGPRQ
jgi:hypothetical protein